MIVQNVIRQEEIIFYAMKELHAAAQPSAAKPLGPEPRWEHADMCDTVLGGQCNCYVPARREAWLKGEWPAAPRDKPDPWQSRTAVADAIPKCSNCDASFEPVKDGAEDQWEHPAADCNQSFVVIHFQPPRAEMRNDSADDARDALRYRRFRALVEYGHFVIQHYPGDAEDCVPMDGERNEVDVAIDDPKVSRKADMFIGFLDSEERGRQRNQVCPSRGDTP